MSNIASIRQTPRKADPLRERLKEAIDAQRQASAAVETHSRALTSTLAAARTAKKAAEAAKDTIADATAERADEIARAAALGKPIPAGDRVRRARSDEQFANDEAAALTQAVEQLRGELVELRKAEAFAAKEVERCVCELFADPAEKLLAEALSLKARLDPMVAALSSLYASDVGQIVGEYGRTDVRGERLDRVRKAMMPLYAKPPERLDGEPWRSARTALLADPDLVQLELNARGTGTS